ncbi:MAG: laccase domain-containing protein [Verrucomicrobiaceae bacterium]|nr:MAG: laccase domain-containing protein [Verrucomicrobiaceae bacterium]
MTEAFPFLDPLNSIPGVRAGWIERYPGLPITGDRDDAMRQLRPFHEEAVTDFAGASADWWRAEQVHGTGVAVVPGSPQIIAPDGMPVVAGTDGLVTASASIVLAIYVADCGAIWLADRKTGAIGLLHSGKKGTEGNIFQVALDTMRENFGTDPADVTAVLSPCIRVPDYDIEFSAEIGEQAKRAGVGEYLDCQLNTAADLRRFYSYRKEMGKTGRMMALITRDPQP